MLIGLSVLLLTGCGEFQKLQKSNDPELKFTKAIEYFNAGKYSRAQLLFDDVSAYYKGTERSEDVLIYLARCYMGQKDYAGAERHLKYWLEEAKLGHDLRGQLTIRNELIGFYGRREDRTPDQGKEFDLD